METANFEVHLTGVGGQPVPVSFETMAQRLRELERLDLEPDGFFVWNVEAGQPWRVTGQIYDNGQRVQYVHLHGDLPRFAFDRLVEQMVPGGAERAQLTCLPSGGLQDLQSFRTERWPESAPPS